MPGLWDKINAGILSEWIKGTLIRGETGEVFSGLNTDSRKIRPGQIFWALRGSRFDGHDFVGSAFERGAAGAVVEKNYCESRAGIEILKSLGSSSRPLIAVENTLASLGTLAGKWRGQNKARIAAITGSAGKTTTKEMAAGILAYSGRTLKNEGNLNNLIGLPLTLVMLESTHENAVLEMGMNRAGEIARLTEITDPDLGLITNVGMAHLEGVGDLDGVARAKTELIEKISQRAIMIINGDDSRLMKAVERFDREFITFGTGPECDIRARRVRTLGREGVSFEIKHPEGTFHVRLRVLGIQNVLNAVAASAIGLSFKTSVRDISAALEHFEGIEGRFKTISLPNGALLIDDTYNANPSSLKTALDSITGLAKERVRLIIGLGEMMELGETAESAHLEAGHWIGELRPHCFLAMGEHAESMVKGALTQGMSHKNIYIIKKHQEMIDRILEETEGNDLIFLKGSRSMGLEKVVKGLKSHMETRYKTNNIKAPS